MKPKHCFFCGEFFYNRSPIAKYCKRHRGVSECVERARNARVRAEKLGLVAHYSGHELYKLVEAYGLRCMRCKTHDWGFMGWVADHIVPLSAGGTNTIENIQILCFACNGQKRHDFTDYRLTVNTADA